MARANDRGDDITAEFWGGAPDWTAAGRRSHRSVERSGPAVMPRQRPVTRPIPSELSERSRVLEPATPDESAALHEPDGASPEPATPIDPLLARHRAIALPVVLAFVLAVGGLFALVDGGDRATARQVMTNAAVTANYADLVGWRSPSGSPETGAAAGVASSAAPAAPESGSAAPIAAESAGAESGVPAAAVLECGLDYQIVPGDYWIRIAESSRVALGDLLAVNGATVDTVLHAGDVICLPRGARYPEPPPVPTTAPPANASSPPPTTIARPVAGAPRPTAGAAANGSSAGSSNSQSAGPSSTAPVARPSSESPAQVEALIRSIWPADLADRAVQIAQRESRLQPGAYNGHCCWGIFQIHWGAHRRWLADHGVSQAQQLLDARTNITLAYEIYRRAGGWGPWRLSGE